MSDTLYPLESSKLFSESLIWQLNREFYQSNGIEAWSIGEVPSQITSNSLVGKTYAELILGFLSDLSKKGNINETVYILELGAGHGRLAFHILKHLEKLITLTDLVLPPYCYVISDIGEKNLNFFKNHPQLKPYYQKGVLDYAYYDAMDGKEIVLRYSGRKIKAGDLKQPIIGLANYFFDSIPNEVFHIKKNKLSICSIALQSRTDPGDSEKKVLIQDIKVSYSQEEVSKHHYGEPVFDRLLEKYRHAFNETYLVFPKSSIELINDLKSLSKKGLLLLSMDKGYHSLTDIDHLDKPDIVNHGSFSLWVNYHALGNCCTQQGGKTLFTSYTSYHLQVAGFLYLENPDTYRATNAAYQRYVNDFGPDDYNSIKKLTYEHMSSMSLFHLLALLRLSMYDSSLFVKLLPRLKVIIKNISFADRVRTCDALHLVWNYYFNINEVLDLAIDIAGIYFDLGYYEHALTYFQHSEDTYGLKMDTCYNKILCYYQLRKDIQFSKALEEARSAFPQSELLVKLDALDLDAK